MLALAALSFNMPSETFIRDHVRTIAPGETVLLCQEGAATEQFDSPVLSAITFHRRAGSIVDLPAKALNYLRLMHAGPELPTADRRRVVAFLAAHRPRALLAEYGPTGCLFMRACEEAGVPLYVHFHGFDASRMIRDWRYVRHYRSLFRQAAGVIAPSRFLTGRLAEIGCPEAKLHVSPYGIDPQRFAVTRRLPQRLVAVGRLVEKKAPQSTIAAFAAIANRYPEARLDMVGDGPLAGKCRALVRRHGLDDRVRLHGVQDARFVADLMQEASVFVQHSVTASDGDCEGLPVAVLEAMASAVPVVSTRHSGIPEAVVDGVTGLLVEEHEVDAMAAAMSALLDDPERAAAMGAAGRRRVLEHYTLDHARDRLRAIMGLAPFIQSQPTAATTLQ